MAYDPVPKCIKCNRTDLKLVSERHRYAESESSRKPISTLSIYQCPCGTGFTHMVLHEAPKSPVATG